MNFSLNAMCQHYYYNNFFYFKANSSAIIGYHNFLISIKVLSISFLFVNVFNVNKLFMF